METIFDFAPTEAELQTLLPTVLSKDEYLAMGVDADSENGRIFRLHMLRGQPATAQTYLARIKDEGYRFNVASVDIL